MLLLGLNAVLFGQERSQEASKIAQEYVQHNLDKYGLQPSDIAGMDVSDNYFSKNNETYHVYFNQKYRGIAVQNAVFGAHIKNGKVFYATNRFISGLGEAVNATEAGLTPAEAIDRAAAYLGLIIDAPLRQVNRKDLYSYEFTPGNIARENIQVDLQYLPDYKTGAVNLAWVVGIFEAGSPDYWILGIDALDGKMLERHNRTLHCSFPAGTGHQHDASCVTEEKEMPTPPLPPAPPSERPTTYTRCPLKAPWTATANWWLNPRIRQLLPTAGTIPTAYRERNIPLPGGTMHMPTLTPTTPTNPAAMNPTAAIRCCLIFRWT